MFADSLWLNLLLFVCGQIAGWSILRSGLLVTGVAVLSVLWIAGDLALVLRFVFGDEGFGYVASLLVTQVTAIGACVAYFGLRHRIGGKDARASQRDEIRAIETALLRGEREDAVARLRKLVRRDPWSVPGRILLAGQLRQVGRPSSAKRLLVGASRIDEGGYRDLIEAELSRLTGGVGANAADVRRMEKAGRPRTERDAGPDSLGRADPGSDPGNQSAAAGGAAGRDGGTEGAMRSGARADSSAKT